MKKHILVISQYFYPESFRINDICKELVDRGYRITVLTGIPNYPEGHFFSGYGFFSKRKTVWNGMDVIRIPLVPRGKSSIQLILNYYSFVVSGWIWSHFTRLKADAVFSFEVSPMTQVLVGKWFSSRRSIPHILYVQDLWPENLEVVGGIHNRFVLGHYARLSNRIYRQCSTILATSPSFVSEIRQLVSELDKIQYWPQYAEKVYRPSSQKSPLVPDDHRFKVVFTGNIGTAQGLEVLPKAARLLDDSVLFVLVGDGRNRAQLEKETADVQSRFLFIDRQPAEAIPSILASCDVAFISFMDNPLFNKTIPAKLQSYMACGMPIVASAGGETQRIVVEASCGLCCRCGDPAALAEVITSIRSMNLSDMGIRSYQYCLDHFEKGVLMDRLEDYLSL